MQAIGGVNRRKRAHRSIAKPSATLLLGTEFEIPVHFYDSLPIGAQYDGIDLEHLINICRERQQALHHVEAVAMMDSDLPTKTSAIMDKLKNLEKLNLTLKPTEKQN